MTTSCLSPTYIHLLISVSLLLSRAMHPTVLRYFCISVYCTTCSEYLTVFHASSSLFLQRSLSRSLSLSHSLAHSLIHPPYNLLRSFQNIGNNLHSIYITTSMNALSFLIFVKLEDSPSSSIDLSSSEYSSSPTYNNLLCPQKILRIMMQYHMTGNVQLNYYARRASVR